jgi:hypothetical protein
MTYPAPAGDIRVRTSRGNIRVTAWDRNEVKIDVVKSAIPPAALSSAEVNVVRGAELCIATKYAAERPPIKTWFGFGGDPCRDPRHMGDVDPATLASMDYSVTVPRNAKLVLLTVAGDVDIEGTRGEIFVDIDKGHLTARDVSGRCQLFGSYSGVNVTLTSLAQDTHIESAVGRLVVNVGPQLSAHVRARAGRGTENDFGWANRANADVEGTLGSGKPLLEIVSHDGHIEIKRLPEESPAASKKPRSPSRGRKPR